MQVWKKCLFHGKLANFPTICYDILCTKRPNFPSNSKISFQTATLPKNIITILPFPPPCHAIHVTHQFANHSFALLYQRSMVEPNLDSKDVHQSGLRVGYENHHCFLHGLVFLAWKTL